MGTKAKTFSTQSNKFVKINQALHVPITVFSSDKYLCGVSPWESGQYYNLVFECPIEIGFGKEFGSELSLLANSVLFCIQV